MLSFAGYASLFVAAFGAATILPLQSEAVLAALVIAKQYPLWALIAVASMGNTLGAVVNWFLGRELERFRDRKWFPVSPAALSRAQDWYARHGRYCLLLSWVPVIGDPLTMVAGIMRERLLFFILTVGVAKTARYVVLGTIITRHI